MTKEEVLQKVNDYCTEKQYTNATLTDVFKDKFADHFVKANPEGNLEDEALLASMKFALNTAFSSASQVITDKTKAFETVENGYKNQIEELKKKIASQQTPPPPAKIPEEITKQLEELKEFKNEQSKQEKFKSILALAKQGIREDCHDFLVTYAKDYEVKLDKDDKEQADALISKVKELLKGRIGDISPLQPQQTQQRDEEFLASLPKVKI